MGKTTVVEMFLSRLGAERERWTTWGQCVEHAKEGEPYLPFVEALGRLGREPAVLAVLRRYAPLWLAQLPGLLRELAEALEALTADRVLAMQGDAAAGVLHLQAGFEGLECTGLKLYRSYFLSLLAEASGQAEQAEAGVTVVTEALTRVAATEERWWEAEVHRLRGALLLQLPLPDVGQAEVCFQQALDVARR